MNTDWISIKNLKTLNPSKIREILLNLPRWFLVLWIGVNLIIPAYGVLLYYWQYAYYHPIFWVFIPDSNTFAILYGIFIIVTLGLKKNIQVLNLITFVGLVKVFFGYILVFTVQPSFFDLVSLSAHIFELFESLLILPFLKVDLKNFNAGLFITLIDWFFDFLNPFGLPTLPLYPLDEINPNNTAPYIDIFFVAFTISLVLIFSYIRLKHWVENDANVKWIEDINPT
jgi:uncharacterized membrane protein YpjA